MFSDLIGSQGIERLLSATNEKPQTQQQHLLQICDAILDQSK
jgi:hypothetical protein